MMTIKEIRFIRENAQNMTRKQLAKEIGKNPETIRNYFIRNNIPHLTRGHAAKIIAKTKPVKFKEKEPFKRPPAVYDNHKPSKYGVAFELHYQKTA